MPSPSPARVSEHVRNVQKYYGLTPDFYLKSWHPEHIHFGVFEPGECPAEGESLVESPGLTKALERMIELTAAPVGIEAGHHVVDAGCGVGGTAIHLAKTLGCTVTGVNVTEPQLELARKKAAAAGLDGRVDFRWADCAVHLPFDDASVDAVVNIECACHFSDRSRFLCEAHRILKPGGRIGAMDWMVPDDLSAGQYEEHIEPICKNWMVHSLDSQATYTRRLREAGLEVVEFEGFDGKDADNITLLDRNYQLLSLMQLGGFEAEGMVRNSMSAINALRTAWRGGHFVLKRYCAGKPAQA